MKPPKMDRDMPIGELRKIEDYLPPPKELAVPERTIMVTLRLSEESVAFFKQQAKRYRTKYQKMLRFLVDRYVERYS